MPNTVLLVGAGITQIKAGTHTFSSVMACNGDDLRDQMYIMYVLCFIMKIIKRNIVMKKVVPIVLAVVLNVVLLVSVILFVCVYIIPSCSVVQSQENSPETFITSSQSPNGEYNLLFHL